MPFSRPSPQAIRDRLAAEIETALPGADARRRRSPEEVLVRAAAVASHELHGHLAWIARQIQPDTADQDALLRHASLRGITRLPASIATGPVMLTGGLGAMLPAGAEARRPDDRRFRLVADAAIGAGGSLTADFAAVEPGAAGNTPQGTVLTLISPTPGILSASIVAAGGIGAGADQEAPDALLARLLIRLREPPQGGARTDYAIWAKEVPGVDRVWVYPLYLGAGTVGVTFLGPNAAIPSAPLVAAVLAAIEEKRPVTAQVFVFAPSAVPVSVTLAISPDTAATRATVSAALAAVFAEEAEPGATVRVSRLSAAISSAAGENWHQITAPAADIALAAGEIATLGAVVWL